MFSSDFQKKFYYALKNWTPPELLPFILRFPVAARFIFQKNKQMLLSNLDLKGKGNGRDAYIIATGPSLKGVDLAFLAGRDCFSVSNFILHPQLDVVCPQMHFFAPYHEPLVYEEYINWLASADRTLPKDTAVVLGLQTFETVEHYHLFPRRKVHYLSLEKVPLRMLPDLKWPVLSPQTSPIMILPMLHYMGYQRVFLLGCDHNILKNYGGAVENFYDVSQDPRSNSTSGDNWKAGIVSHLEYALNVFNQYKFYKSVYEKSGMQIFNSSDTGWLDFFEYISINELRKF